MPSARSQVEPRRDDIGAAVVEFVLVGFLVLLVAFGVLQVGLVFHARNVLAADAAEGARHAASLGVDVASGGAAAERLARSSLPGAGQDLRCVSRQTAGPGAVPIVEVTCTTDLQLGLLPVGHVHVAVSGRAVKETLK